MVEIYKTSLITNQGGQRSKITKTSPCVLLFLAVPAAVPEQEAGYCHNACAIFIKHLVI
jgi:hypothetical protein